MTAIELQGVTVVLGGRPVVDATNASVAEGEWLALIGPNGAGKTTLLRAIARLVPFSGLITLGGRSIREMRRVELARLVAVVPQEPSTPPWMTDRTCPRRMKLTSRASNRGRCRTTSCKELRPRPSQASR